MRQTFITKVIKNYPHKDNVDRRPVWPLKEHVINCVIIAGMQHGESYKSTERTLHLISRVIVCITKSWDIHHHQHGYKVVNDVLMKAGS